MKLPDGAAPVPEALQTKFLAIANNGDLSAKDRAQALVDLQQEIYGSASEASSMAWDTLQETWQGEIKALPVNANGKYEANMAEVNRVVTQFGTPALNKALADTGMTNHPEMFSFLLKIAPFILEGKAPGGNPGGGPVNDEAASLARRFPSMYPKTTT